jgi:hypothetical protein
MERFFQILAVILAGVAAYFLWKGNNDGAFISAVLGSVSFFLSIRFQVKGRLEQRAAEKEEREKGRRGEGENEELAVGSSSLQLNETSEDEIFATNNEQRTTDKEVV